MKNLFKTAILAFGLLLPTVLSAQTTEQQSDSLFIRQLYRTALLNESTNYGALKHFIHNFPGRWIGAKSLDGAIDWAVAQFQSYGADTVWTQPVHCEWWLPGNQWEVYLQSDGADFLLESVPLGHSAATSPLGLTAGVLMVNSIEELRQKPEAAVRGKIVFFNGKFPNDAVDRFGTYAGIYPQRCRGAEAAAQKGAVASLTRSLTSDHENDVAHAGGTYFDKTPPIPALSLGWLSANQLETAVLAGKSVQMFVKTSCETRFEGFISRNVIAEIRGSEYPDEVIVLGAHIDSWFNTPGAHDDGTGCIAALEVLHIFRSLGYQPKRTVHFVLWTNEELGGAGSEVYAQFAAKEKKKPIAALESDRGGYYPLGFYLNSRPELEQLLLTKFAPFDALLKQHDLNVQLGEAADDVEPLRPLGTALLNLKTSSLNYFDLHHTRIDTVDKVNPNELALNVAAMATIVFLIDKYGL